MDKNQVIDNVLVHIVCSIEGFKLKNEYCFLHQISCSENILINSLQRRRIDVYYFIDYR